MTDPRPCPVCGEPLQPEQQGAVTLDVCEAHGVWLDNGELDTITMSVTRRMGKLSKGRVRRALRYGRRGWFSTLFAE